MDVNFFQKWLKGLAPSLLYVFLPTNIQWTTAMRTKRDNQIKFLKIVDKFAWFRNYDELKSIVRLGIIERYGHTPESILYDLYSVAKTPIKISGIGAVNPDELSDEEYNAQMQAEHAAALADLEVDDIDPETGKKEKKNFWDSAVGSAIKAFFNWLITDPNSKKLLEQNIPNPKDYSTLFPKYSKNTVTSPTSGDTKKKSSTGTFLTLAATALFALR